MSAVIDAIANTAFSFTLSGNSGISPFLTMFLIGAFQKISPDKFNMDETLEKIMSSWPSLVGWGILTALEYMGKCIPILDQIIDYVEVFVVPFISILGTFSSFGSFGSSDDNTESPDGSSNNDNIYASSRKDNESITYGSDVRAKEEELYEVTIERSLTTAKTMTNLTSVKSGIGHFFQVILILVGMVLALILHFFKMLIRLISMGCLTPCITIVEATIVCSSVLISIFVRQFAIFIAACMIVAVIFTAKKKCDKWNENEEEEALEREQQPILQEDPSAPPAESLDGDEYHNMENQPTVGIK